MVNEFKHDGLHVPSHPTKRHEAGKPTIYYIGLDETENFSNYGKFVMVNGNLTTNASNNAFKNAGVTTKKDVILQRLDQIQKKYGNKFYIFVFKEEYTLGTQTHKRHARPSVVDIWYPKGQYWKYSLQALDESCCNEADNDVDQKTIKSLNSLKDQCLQQWMKMKNSSNKFKEFSFEGQQLANFWLNISNALKFIANGKINADVIKYFDQACEKILNANEHKSPKPYDDKDIK